MFDNNSKKIETGVDKLLRLIDTKQEISVTEASAELDVDKEIVDHWADALGEQDLIKIRLTLGEKFLVWPEYHTLTNGNGSLIKDILRISKNGTSKKNGDYLKSREQELNKKIKVIAKNMDKLKKLKKECSEKEVSIREETEDLKELRKKVINLESQVKKREEALEKKEKQSRKKRT